MNKLVEIRVADALESIERIEDAMNKARKRRDKAREIADQLVNNVLTTGLIDRLKVLAVKCQQILDKPDLPLKLDPQMVSSAAVACDELMTQLSGIHERAKILGDYRMDMKTFDQHKARSTVILQEKRFGLKQIGNTLTVSRF